MYWINNLLYNTLTLDNQNDNVTKTKIIFHNSEKQKSYSFTVKSITCTGKSLKIISWQNKKKTSKCCK